MKLLIIGAGGHGKVVADIAEQCGYENIAFLDDDSSEAIGKISELDKYMPDYDKCFVAIGNNVVRNNLIAMITDKGYNLATLVHPTAIVSKDAIVKQGTVVEQGAIINRASTVGVGCIISLGAIIDHDVVIGDCCHINAGAVCKAGATVEACTKIDAGQVVKGY